MFFKDALIYRFTEEIPTITEKALQDNEFTPCGRQDRSKYGWVSPADDLFDELIVEEGSLTIICARREEKILPVTVINEKVREKVRYIEKSEDRRVHRKERETLKEEIIFDLLPQAFTKSTLTHAYIDHKQQILVINTGTYSKAEELMKLLRDSVGSLPVVPVQVSESPAITMTNWLRGEPLPEGFELLKACNLAEMREGGSKARLKDQELLADEIEPHLNAGKQVEMLELEYDERVKLKLHDDLAMKQLKFSEDLISESADRCDGDKIAQFRTNFVLMSAAMRDLYSDVLGAFGGNRPDPMEGL
ncbi:recombination-associated protein RdgC [Pseudomaricurvus alkylphenolicus]|uniref:recombination-associated protein RdgC n=1 Tax=Pseudomaricurvus alkylphenolicus TaxID=1306991 RepID=UPI001421288D|nr:recombination-associated protein RdgC [Pseudomaricurvus alkylphenolicus]NIB43787.1 recombination-associated protein RdgC [Pseudomaricurvus alkylphenolicus]